MLDIYKYSLAHQFLRDGWLEKKKNNPSFSLRAWARILGLKSNAPLSLMLAGKRAIPRKYLPKMIASLRLSRKEAEYLECLIYLSGATTPEQKELYSKRLANFAPRPTLAMKEIESYKIISDPLHATILEMTELRGFRSDPRWIQSRLRRKVSLLEIGEVIQRLVELNLLQMTSTGDLTKTHQHVSNRADYADQGVQEYHRAASQLAALAVANEPVLEREFNGYAINIPHEALPRAKELIRSFICNFAEMIEAKPGQGAETYQLNVQFFPLTKKQGEKK